MRFQYYLRAAGRTAVDQHHHRIVFDPGIRMGFIQNLLPVAPPPGGDNGAVIQKDVRHSDRLFQQAARIVAQIQHQPPDRLLGPKLVQRCERQRLIS